jgi:hypothetical protein
MCTQFSVSLYYVTEVAQLSYESHTHTHTYVNTYMTTTSIILTTVLWAGLSVSYTCT